MKMNISMEWTKERERDWNAVVLMLNSTPFEYMRKQISREINLFETLV